MKISTTTDNKVTISPTLTLIALAISAFAIGSTEFISVGLLPLISNSFGVSISNAGLTVSVYALWITIGAPLMTLLTSRIPRKQLLIYTMLLFIIGNLIDAIAPTFTILLLGRVIASLAHGIFMTISSVIASNVVAPNKRASAIAIMFTGLTVATLTGMPLGTYIGNTFSWHFSFLFITIVGVISLIANILLVPSNLPLPEKSSIKGIGRILSDPQLLLVLALTVVGYGSPYVIYTYLSPILAHLGYSSNMIVWLLLLYGVMVAIGNTIGGRLADKNPVKALLGMFASLIAAYLLVIIFFNSHWLGLIAVLIMGMLAFMNVPGLQLYIVQLAEKNTPNDVTMASALNISAFNIGITLGSMIGGQVVAHVGLSATPYFSIGMAVITVLLNIWLLKMAAQNK
ncbi:MFS transporter [Lentilactobacillus senioris]|uniref:MFS transporter n=1 Tax=Lentilactobacillus senioris TaxID=931534 RepID=UPI0022811381|nr:MFS transporter [Lentilactobacillus senioris]MCY9806156.1 MFS transporter [Lentilactobacillus senioris]